LGYKKCITDFQFYVNYIKFDRYKLNQKSSGTEDGILEPLSSHTAGMINTSLTSQYN
jgi:hypothetical protein